MEKGNISEILVKDLLNQLLNEDIVKVKREEFNRVQFKIEELENSLSETMKEMRKLQESIPNGLKTVTNGRITGASQSLYNAQKFISQLKEKIRHHKKQIYSQQQVEEKKK
jgi:uncharacterized protein YoxC